MAGRPLQCGRNSRNRTWLPYLIENGAGIILCIKAGIGRRGLNATDAARAYSSILLARLAAIRRQTESTENKQHTQK
jgi:hypothetical protein